MTKVLENHEGNNANTRPLATVIPQSKEELLECIQNLMGVFDTPVSRRAIKGEFVDEVRKIGRQILESNGKSMYDI